MLLIFLKDFTKTHPKKRRIRKKNLGGWVGGYVGVCVYALNAIVFPVAQKTNESVSEAAWTSV